MKTPAEKLAEELNNTARQSHYVTGSGKIVKNPNKRPSSKSRVSREAQAVIDAITKL